MNTDQLWLRRTLHRSVRYSAGETSNVRRQT